jgi:hypothetical protein
MVLNELNRRAGASHGGVAFDFGIRLGDNEQGKGIVASGHRTLSRTSRILARSTPSQILLASFPCHAFASEPISLPGVEQSHSSYQ